MEGTLSAEPAASFTDERSDNLKHNVVSCLSDASR